MHSSNMVLIFLVLAVFSVPYLNVDAISWSLHTSPAVFGKDVELKCQLPNDTNLVKTRQWSKNATILVIDGVSIDKTKYVENMDKMTRTSTLTISSLDKSDINVPYTCQYGVETYEDLLDLTIENFESHPKGKQTDIHYKEKEIQFWMRFDEVYPVPTCSAFIGKVNLTNKLEIGEEQQGPFYAVNISLKYTDPNKDCIKHILDLTCHVGTEKIVQEFKTTPELCLESPVKPEEKHDVKKKSDKDQSIGDFGRAVFIVVTILYVVVIPCVVAYVKNTKG